MANTGNTLLALITGAAIGAAVGVLYAPESGDKTREKLGRDARKAQDKLNKKYKETSTNLTTKVRKAKMDFESRLEETLSSASHKADEILTAMEAKLEDLRRQNAKLQKESKNEEGRTNITDTTATNKAVV